VEYLDCPGLIELPTGGQEKFDEPVSDNREICRDVAC